MSGRGAPEYALPEGVTKAEAQRLAQELQLRDWRIEQGLQAPPSRERLAEAWERYRKAIADQPSIVATASRWKRHILPALGSVPVQQLRPTQVEALLQDMKKAGYSQQMCRHVRMTLSGCFEWLKKDGVVDLNPVDKVKAIAVPAGEPKAQPLEVVQAIADAATFPGLRYLVLTLFYTAGRPGAMLQVRKQHVHLAAPATLRFPTTKGGKPHTVALVLPAVALLQDLFHNTPGEHLFLNSKGTPLTLRRAERAFKVALKRAGFVGGWEAACRRKGCGHKEPRRPTEGERCPRCKFRLWAKALPSPLCLKDMRSSAATHIVEHLPAEEGMRVAQAHLGHAPGSAVTGKHYVAKAKEEAVAAAVARAFGEHPEDPEPLTH
jgi:integrase